MIEIRLVTPMGQPNPLLNHVRELGLIGTKSGTKFIPHIYKTASISDRLSLLAGIVDSDGYLAHSYYFDLTTKSTQLAGDIAFVARSLGFACYVTPKICSGFGVTGVYQRLKISGETSVLPCKRDIHKNIPIRRQKKNPLRTGFSVSDVGDGPYTGLRLTVTDDSY